MTHLSPCSRCARHVRSSERHCPFCGAPFEHTAANIGLPKGLKRAAVIALSTAAASTSVACGASGDDGDEREMTDTPAAGGGANDLPTQQPVYGAPVPSSESSGNDSGGSDGQNNSGPQQGAGGSQGTEEPIPEIQPLYGAPPNLD